MRRQGGRHHALGMSESPNLPKPPALWSSGIFDVDQRDQDWAGLGWSSSNPGLRNRCADTKRRATAPLTVKNPGSQSTEGLGSQWLTSRDSSSPGREHRTGPVCLGDCKEGGKPLEELRLRGV